MERNKWSEEQDRVLVEIMNTEKEPIKWNQVSEIFNQKLGSAARTGKQCRQRWHNNLNPIFNSSNWTMEEENIMVNYQNQKGNRWSEIAKLLHNRTDIYIKNQYYSLFRKLIRKINKIFHQFSLRPFARAVINKILSINNQRFIDLSQKPTQIFQITQEIKDIMLSFRFTQGSENLKEKSFRLNQLINQFKVHVPMKKMKRKKELDLISQESEFICRKSKNNKGYHSQSNDITNEEKQVRQVNLSSRSSKRKQKEFREEIFVEFDISEFLMLDKKTDSMNMISSQMIKSQIYQ